MSSERIRVQGFMGWLDEQGVDLCALGPRWDRRVRYWRAGTCANAALTTVDEFLLHLGLHLSYLPEELFCEGGRGKAYPSDVKQMTLEKKTNKTVLAT